MHDDKKAFRKWITLLSIILILIFAANSLTAYSEEDRTGGIAHYNGLVFDYFESLHGSMEGALAVGGIAKFGVNSGQYDVGASAHYAYIGTYENPEKFPTLLLQAMPQIGMSSYSNINIYGGPVMMGDTLEELYNAGTNQFYAADGVEFLESRQVQNFFDQSYNAVKKLNYTVNHAYTDDAAGNAGLLLKDFVGWNTTAGIFDDLTVYEPDNITGPDELKVVVIQVTDEGHIEINGPQLTSAFEKYDMVVFNFPNTTSVRFTGASVMIDQSQINPNAVIGTGENALLKQYAGKIIWSFPKAETIQVAGTGVVGSVMAPDAYMEGSGGSVSGMAIVDSLYMGGGFGLNSFKIPDKLFELSNKDGEEVLSGSVHIAKFDRMHRASFRGQLLLSGAEFDLYRKNGKGQYEQYNEEGRPYITQGDGVAKITGLPVGEYYLKETEPPYGYYLDEQEYHFTIDAGHGIAEPVWVAVGNRKISKDIVVKKVDKENPLLGLQGAHFILYKIEGRNIEIVDEVDSDYYGNIILQELEYGQYRLMEIESPPGYTSVVDEYIDFFLHGDSKGNLAIQYRIKDGEPVTLFDEDDLRLPNTIAENASDNRLVVTKVDMDDKDIPLEGAVFTLSKLDGEGHWEEIDTDLVTDYYGHIIIEDIEAGTYRLMETESPEGYEAHEEETVITIEDSGMLRPTKTHYVTIGDKAQGKIVVEKTDSTEPEKKLSGAEFFLYYDLGTFDDDEDSRWEEIDSGETDENGELVFENLRPGKYHLIQTRAPEGYVPIEEPQEAGMAIISYIYDENNEKVTFPVEAVIEVASEPAIGAAVIFKVDGDTYVSGEHENAEILTGAVFNLHRYDETTHEWLSFRDNIIVNAADSGYEISELPEGKFKLEEVKAPDGYEFDDESGLNETIFVISMDTNDSKEELVIKNYKIRPKGYAVIRKTDEDSHPLAGAVFQLEKQINETEGFQLYRTDLTTDENGRLEISDLSPGTYRLHETTPPEGYEPLKDSVPFHIEIEPGNPSAATSVNIALTNKKTEMTEPEPSAGGSGSQPAENNENSPAESSGGYHQNSQVTNVNTGDGDRVVVYKIVLLLALMALCGLRTWHKKQEF